MAKKHMHDQQAMMDAIMENATVSITLMDYDGHFTFFNKQAEKHLKFPPEIIKTRSVAEIFPDEGPATLKSVRKIFKDKTPVSVEVSYTIEGKMRSFEINRIPLLNEKGDVYSVLSISRDITENKHDEKLSEIYHNIDSLQSIGETFEESITILFENLFKLDWVDAGGIYLVNEEKKMLELIYHQGLSEDFVNKVTAYDFESGNAKVAFGKVPNYVSVTGYQSSSKENLIREKLTFVASLPLVHRDRVMGLLNLASCHVIEIDASDRHSIEIIAMKIGNLIELIKTRKELDRSNEELNSRLKELNIKQQLLVQKSRLESLGELSAGLAHEINQPLSVISLVLENINYKLGQKAATEDYLSRKFITINQNINKIRELVDHVRIFSRDQGTIMFEQVDVNKVIHNALSMIGSQLKNHQVKVSLELSDDIGFTIGNPSRLEQVILNLLSNARDALAEKEKKTISDVLVKEILIKTYREDDLIMIRVRDNGSGISPQNLSRIFIPFFTTKDEGQGTGLGLSIVYGIIREMKGDITAHSEVGVFTEITITLPLFKIFVDKK